MWSDVAEFFTYDPAFFAGSVFLVGLVVGSFLNVVIYRMPVMLEREWRAQALEVLASTDAAPAVTPVADPPEPFTLSTPASACPNCKAPIRAWQNIPLVSWLMLRARCAACKTPISIRYPLVELSTGILSAWVAWHFGFGPAAACALGITWVLIALTGIDIDTQLLPDNLTQPLLWAGLLAALLIGPQAGVTLPVSLHDAVLGAIAGYLSLWSIFQLFKMITGKEGMGYGDFKLFAALGAWLGWQLLPLIMLLSACTGALLGIGMIVFRGRDRTVPIPFGPYLAAAGWIAMMYGDGLMNGYLHLSGTRH